MNCIIIKLDGNNNLAIDKTLYMRIISNRIKIKENKMITEKFKGTVRDRNKTIKDLEAKIQEFEKAIEGLHDDLERKNKGDVKSKIMSLEHKLRDLTFKKEYLSSFYNEQSIYLKNINDTISQSTEEILEHRCKIYQEAINQIVDGLEIT